MKNPLHFYDFGYYGPDSITWKIGREWAVLLGGGRAVLMQLAHPLVALGVSNHSDYMKDPFGRANRTFLRGEELTFGASRLARRSARMINNQHKHVHGIMPIDAGRFRRGTPYDARDPELLLWVHATLIDTVLLCYQTFVQPLTHAEEEQYYQESKTSGHLLGLQPQQMPESIDDLKAYINEMVSSDSLAPTLQARELAFQTLFPPARPTLRPLMHLNLNLTNALLPQQVREIYGFEWNRSQQRTFDLAARSMRLVLPRMPARLRELPITRALMRGESRRLMYNESPPASD
ncbi:MAG TPA: oxygenase MpaB family protein [Ktedonobacteraceae bacterium]|nr:oxygenase MpaB family protein [Ktedonobacteraceae bacterium]